MNTSFVIGSQLLTTKFYVPVTARTLISRPRLTGLLAESLKHPFTLVSAPAGFGKTMLLSAWAQSLPASHAMVAWLSLDEEDNDPQLFWTYVLWALDQRQPERFTSLLKSLQSVQAPPLTYILTALCNLVLESQEPMVLILDDYHVITEQEVHSTLSYLIEHLVPQLHIVVSTRVDPPLPLSLLRARQQMVEVRTEQLRCTAEETGAFFQEVIGIQLSGKTIREVTDRTEGWLVGLQLLGLSLPERADPLTVLREASGDQRYILDYLTEVVLRQQPQEVQTFLLCTCILKPLSASLCDAVWNQPWSLHFRSLYTIMDQVRLWLACGEVDCVMHWAEMLDMAEYKGTPLAREREEVARAHVLLGAEKLALSLQRLELVLPRAIQGKRWGNVMEIQLLQALAHHMLHEVPQALTALLEAVRLAEPEGYIRSFVDEGTPKLCSPSYPQSNAHLDQPPILTRCWLLFKSSATERNARSNGRDHARGVSHE